MNPNVLAYYILFNASIHADSEILAHARSRALRGVTADEMLLVHSISYWNRHHQVSYEVLERLERMEVEKMITRLEGQKWPLTDQK